ncbi:MAG: DegV family protein [Firmicutes bacterium]|nr:DegV family protein [Bacillota bacterium]
MTKSRFVIIGDSSLDYSPELNEWLQVVSVPLSISIGEQVFVDDEQLNIEQFLDLLEDGKEVPKSAAPSPAAYLEAMQGAEEGVFIITLSSRLSGSYNSAMMAKQMAAEKYPGLKVQVIDSLAASAGETTIAIKIRQCIEAEMSFEEIAAAAEDFRDHDKLYFLLDNIDVLVKNGRMSLLKGKLAMLLNIKPILGDDGDGSICLENKARSYTKALGLLARCFIETPLLTEGRTLVIAHCRALAQATKLKEMIAALRKYKDIIIVPMKGLSSTYANICGLVCAC